MHERSQNIGFPVLEPSLMYRTETWLSNLAIIVSIKLSIYVSSQMNKSALTF
jgi:hypothetical protein